MTRALDDLSAFLFHESRDAWLLLDPATDCILDANAAAEQLTGRSRDDLRTTTATDLLRKSSPPLAGTRKAFPAGAPLQLLTLTAGTAPLPAAGRSSPPSATVLMVDDEPLIRALGRAVLERAGYRVILAVDGQEAVELYRQARGTIDLVVLDLTMPRLSGAEALRQLTELDPMVRVILSSGYSDSSEEDLAYPQVRGTVAKPYRPDDLLRGVRAALEDKSAE
jgi:two-component system cell cycle sensor histidine kinase/response regulator CckA